MSRYRTGDDPRVGSHEGRELRTAMEETERLDRPRRIRRLASELVRLQRDARDLPEGGVQLLSDCAAHLRGYAELVETNADQPDRPIVRNGIVDSFRHDPELGARLQKILDDFAALPKEERDAHFKLQAENYAENLRREIAGRKPGETF